MNADEHGLRRERQMVDQWEVAVLPGSFRHLFPETGKTELGSASAG